jgi:HEPN domain-containing protein
MNAQQWLDLAQYDLETARAMLDSRRNLYVLFCCQQALEKSLKAVFAHRFQKMPPRTHNLPRLVEMIGLEANSEDMDFFAMLSIYYVNSRYTEDQQKLAAAINNKRADDAFRNTERIKEWLQSMIP